MLWPVFVVDKNAKCKYRYYRDEGHFMKEEFVLFVCVEA